MAREMFGFVEWEKSIKYAPLATFGHRTSFALSGNLVCAQPILANKTLINSAEIAGNFVLVERGGCTFPEKARFAQTAGAIGMIVANHEADFPSSSFTMGEMEKGEGGDIHIPCVMLSYDSIQALMGYIDGDSADKDIKVSILNANEASLIMKNRPANALHNDKKMLGDSSCEDSVAGKLFRKSSTLLKYIENSSSSIYSNVMENNLSAFTEPTDQAIDLDTESETTEIDLLHDNCPYFTFIRWSTTGDTYNIYFSPLADFVQVDHSVIYRSKFIFCDPPMANKDIINVNEVAGNIVFIERGGCTFPEKIERAQRAGALAVVFGNNDTKDPDSAFVISVDNLDVNDINIPSVMVSYRIAEKLRLEKPFNISVISIPGEVAGSFIESQTAQYSLSHPPNFKVSLPPLHLACINQDFNTASSILRNSRSDIFSQKDGYLMTPLHHACISGDLKIVNIILKYVDKQPLARKIVNMIDLGGQSPLHYACLTGNVEIVERLILSQACVAQRNEGGRTPLHLACISGSTECIELVLTANASIANESKTTYIFYGVNEKDLERKTPLHIAALQGNLSCVLYLLAANCKINEADLLGHTPLFYICNKSINYAPQSQEALRVLEKMIDQGIELKENEFEYIQSKSLRREIEVCYLQKQIQIHKQENTNLEKRVALLEETTNLLVDKDTKKSVQMANCMRSLEMQSKNIHLLQLQMKSILQLPQKVRSHDSISLSSNIHQGDTLELFPAKETTNEVDLAEDAALMREIAKKHARNQSYEDAVKCFQKSLSLYPLPGVQQLLKKAEKRRSELANSIIRKRQDLDNLKTKENLLNQYYCRLQSCGAPANALELIKEEISKVLVMDKECNEYIATKNWLEWLLSLPWDRSSIQQAFSKSMFDELENVQAAEKENAALVIQFAVKEFTALKHIRRNNAAKIIQSTILQYHRLKRVRLQQSTTVIASNSSHSATSPIKFEVEGSSFQEDTCVSIQNSKLLESDLYGVDKPLSIVRSDVNGKNARSEPCELSPEELVVNVDSFFPKRFRNVVLKRGIKLIQLPYFGDENNRSETDVLFHILQIVHVKLQLSSECSSILNNLMLNSNNEEVYYVWNRWGVLGRPSQSALKGPYDFNSAVREFEQKYKEKTGNLWTITKENYVVHPKQFKPTVWPSNNIEKNNPEDG